MYKELVFCEISANKQTRKLLKKKKKLRMSAVNGKLLEKLLKKFLRFSFEFVCEYSNGSL